jgi:hypothetical protein
VTVELRTGDQPIVIETGEGSIHVRLGPATNADATLAGEPKPIMGLLVGFIGLDEARAAGVTYDGDPAIVDRIREQAIPAAAAS